MSRLVEVLELLNYLSYKELKEVRGQCEDLIFDVETDYAGLEG